MKTITCIIILLIAIPVLAGTWTDNFSDEFLGPQWRRDRDSFSISDGALKGINAHPILILPLRWVEVGKNWDDYVVQCRINVVEPNLLDCTKGALILRHNGSEGYVFALHVATRTAEVFRLSDNEMLLTKEEPLELKTWYNVRAELQGENLSFYLNDKLIGKLIDRKSASGSIGLAVQDVMSVLFDDFTVTGAKVDSASAAVKSASKTPVLWASIKSGG